MIEFFKEDSDLSMMRLCTLLIVVTCCIMVLGCGYIALKATDTSVIDRLTFLILPFAGLALASKVAHKKMEHPGELKEDKTKE